MNLSPKKIRFIYVRTRVSITSFLAAMAVLGFILFLSACNKANNSIDRSVASLSLHYQQNHDYQSLVLLIPHLELKMKWSEIESILGEPSSCPSENECYYSSDAYISTSCPYGNGATIDTCLDIHGNETASSKPLPLTLIILYDVPTGETSSPEDTLNWLGLGMVDN